MAFITETPSPQDARRFQAEKWLHNEFSLWTIDRARECFLIFLRKSAAVGGLPEREDYYFSYRGKVGIISTVLQLQHQGNDLIYRWHLISSLGLAHQLQSDPQVLLLNQGGDTRGGAHLDEAEAQDALTCLEEAFLNYKAYLGVREGGGQHVAFDTAPLTGHMPPLEI